MYETFVNYIFHTNSGLDLKSWVDINFLDIFVYIKMCLKLLKVSSNITTTDWKSSKEQNSIEGMNTINIGLWKVFQIILFFYLLIFKMYFGITLS